MDFSLSELLTQNTPEIVKDFRRAYLRASTGTRVGMMADCGRRLRISVR